MSTGGIFILTCSRKIIKFPECVLICRGNNIPAYNYCTLKKTSKKNRSCDGRSISPCHPLPSPLFVLVHADQLLKPRTRNTGQAGGGVGYGEHRGGKFLKAINQIIIFYVFNSMACIRIKVYDKCKE
jgi:hypothetical protein